MSDPGTKYMHPFSSSQSSIGIHAPQSQSGLTLMQT